MIDSNSLGSLAGKTLVGPDGDSIGKIKDVYESTDGGGGTFATVTTGMFGTGSSFFPLDAADLRGDDVSVPFDKGFIKDAPRVENDEELSAPEEERLFDYYRGGGTGAATATTTTTTTTDKADTGRGRETVGRDTSGPSTDDYMTRSEEQLKVGTRQSTGGKARLRKYVTTETQQATVPVTHEEVRLEREPITDANAGQAYDGPAISEEEHEVDLRSEEAVVTTEAVPVERVRVDKETVTEQQTVRGEVRKENIELETDGVAADPDDRG